MAHSTYRLTPTFTSTNEASVLTITKLPHNLLMATAHTHPPPSADTKLIPALRCVIPIFNQTTVKQSYLNTFTQSWPTLFSAQFDASPSPSSDDDIFSKGCAEFGKMQELSTCLFSTSPSDPYSHHHRTPAPGPLCELLSKYYPEVRNISTATRTTPPQQRPVAKQMFIVGKTVLDGLINNATFSSPALPTNDINSVESPEVAQTPQVFRTTHPCGLFEQLIIPSGITALDDAGIEYEIVQTAYPPNLPLIKPATCVNMALNLPCVNTFSQLATAGDDPAPNPPTNSTPQNTPPITTTTPSTTPSTKPTSSLDNVSPELLHRFPRIDFPPLLNQTALHTQPAFFTFPPPKNIEELALRFCDTQQSSPPTNDSTPIDLLPLPPQSLLDIFHIPDVQPLYSLFPSLFPLLSTNRGVTSLPNVEQTHPPFTIPFSIIFLDVLEIDSVYAFLTAIIHLVTWRNHHSALFPTHLHHNLISDSFPHHPTATQLAEWAPVDFASSALRILLFTTNSEKLDQDPILTLDQIHNLLSPFNIDLTVHNLHTYSSSPRISRAVTSSASSPPPDTPSGLVSSEFYATSIKLSHTITKTLLSLYLSSHPSYRPQTAHGSFYTDAISTHTFQLHLEQYQSGIAHLERIFDRSLSVPPQLINPSPLYLKFHQIINTILSNRLHRPHTALLQKHPGLLTVAPLFNQAHIPLLSQHNIHIHQLNMPMIILGDNFLNGTDKDREEQKVKKYTNAADLPCIPAIIPAIIIEDLLATRYEHFITQRLRLQSDQEPSANTSQTPQHHQHLIQAYIPGTGLFKDTSFLRATIEPNLTTPPTPNPSNTSTPLRPTHSLSPLVSHYSPVDISELDFFVSTIDHPTERSKPQAAQPTRQPQPTDFLTTSPMSYSSAFALYDAAKSSNASIPPSQPTTLSCDTKSAPDNDYSNDHHHHVLLNLNLHQSLSAPSVSQHNICPNSVPGIIFVHFGIPSDHLIDRNYASNSLTDQLMQLDPYRFRNTPIFVIFVLPLSLTTTKNAPNFNDGTHSFNNFTDAWKPTKPGATPRSPANLDFIIPNRDAPIEPRVIPAISSDTARLDLKKRATSLKISSSEYLAWMCLYQLTTIRSSSHKLWSSSRERFLSMIGTELESKCPPAGAIFDTSTPSQLLSLLNNCTIVLNAKLAKAQAHYDKKCAQFEQFWGKYYHDINAAHLQFSQNFRFARNSISTSDKLARYYSVTTDKYILYDEIPALLPLMVQQEHLELSQAYLSACSQLTRFTEQLRHLEKHRDLFQQQVDLQKAATKKAGGPGWSAETLPADIQLSSTPRRIVPQPLIISEDGPRTPNKVYQFVVTEHGLKAALKECRELALMEFFTNQYRIWGSSQ